jgi:Icc protein
MHQPDRTVIQLSDPHLVAEEGPEDERVALALRTIVRSGIRPAALLITGDLSDDGSPESYRRLRALVDPVAVELDVDVLALPGNHDEHDAFRAQVLDGGPAHRAVVVRGLRIVVLDTTVPGAAHGELGAGQLEWLGDVLEDDVRHGTILALHHPPIPSAHPVLGRIALRDPDRLRRVLRGSDVRMIVCGHAHAVAAGALGRVPVWSAPALASTNDALPDAGRVRAWTGLGGLTRIDLFGDEAVASLVPLLPGLGTLYDDPQAERTAWLDAG